jgi:hypothetical protein
VVTEYSGTTLIGPMIHMTTTNAPGGFRRGELESALRHLIGLASEATEETVVGEAPLPDETEENDPAAMMHADHQDEGQDGQT